jgi:hypothetical protein
VLLVFIFSLMIPANGLFHLGYMAIRRRYFPGGMTAGVSAPLGFITMLFAARRLFSR